MGTDAPFPNQGQILSGWKEIARYIGKGVRTVQRYEKDSALPVHRPTKKDRGAVMASTTDLDAWMRARPLPGEDAGGSYDSLLAEMIRFQKNCKQMRELRRALRGSIAMLQSSIQKVSLDRSRSLVTRTSLQIPPANF